MTKEQIMFDHKPELRRLQERNDFLGKKVILWGYITLGSLLALLSVLLINL